MTILGQHTINETRDLIRAQQFRITKNDQQFSKVRAQRFSPPSSEQSVLDMDWANFMRVWTDTRDRETLAMAAGMAANPTVSPDVLPAEKNFKAVNSVLTERIPHLKDLEQRINDEAKTLGLTPTDLSRMPSQDSPDADFNAMKKLDAAIKDSGNPLGKPGGSDSVARSPLGIALIVGAVAALAGGVIYVKKVVF